MAKTRRRRRVSGGSERQDARTGAHRRGWSRRTPPPAARGDGDRRAGELSRSAEGRVVSPGPSSLLRRPGGRSAGFSPAWSRRGSPQRPSPGRMRRGGGRRAAAEERRGESSGLGGGARASLGLFGFGWRRRTQDAGKILSKFHQTTPFKFGVWNLDGSKVVYVSGTEGGSSSVRSASDEPNETKRSDRTPSGHESNTLSSAHGSISDHEHPQDCPKRCVATASVGKGPLQLQNKE